MKAASFILAFLILGTLSLRLFLLGAVLSPQFLDFPLADSSVAVSQGWIYDDGSPHKGIDFPQPVDTAVLAVADGLAVSSVQMPEPGDPTKLAYGTFVIIFHQEGLSTLYAHLNHVASGIPFIPDRRTVDASSGVIVRQGDIIGHVGNSGVLSSSPHLHFEVATNSSGTYLEHVHSKVDPYDIRNTGDSYPPAGIKFTKCGPEFLWKSCPFSSQPLIFSNIGADGTYESGLRFAFGYDASLNRTVSVAFPFTSGRNDRLSRLEIGIVPVAQGGTVRIELRTDLNGLPGDVLESWLTDMPQSGTLESPRVALSSVSNPALALGRQYWLVATAAPGAGRGQWFTVSNDPSRFLRSIDGGPWSGVSSSRGAMRLFGFGETHVGSD